jgi:DNA topoisomerase-1
MPPKTKILTPIKCEKCGSAMILRDSKRGPFLGCSAFPKCRATKQMKKLEGDELKLVEALVPALKEGNEKAREMAAEVSSAAGLSIPAAARAGPIATDIDCDECGKPMIIREGRRGKFLGCSGYPKCKNTAEVPAKLMDELAAAAGPAAAPTNGKPVAPLGEDIETELSVE